MSSTPVNQDPALVPPPPAAAPPAGAPAADPAAIPQPLDGPGIVQLLRHFPNVYHQLIDEQGTLKESAAEALSALGSLGQPQASNTPAGGPSGLPFPLQKQQPPPTSVHSQQALALLALAEPGPSSHPNGPPNLGQLSALAAAAGGSGAMPVPDSQGRLSDSPKSGVGDAPLSADSIPSAPAPRSRGARSANMGSDEWARQRKDNHKEVERRRRGNINEGINELGRIVPNGSGEKAKGAILSRAVQYIHHLKENEARNIEKWTLEKLLMDQAMGDLQAQLEEMRRMWEEERAARTRAESELDVLRGLKGPSVGNDGAATDKTSDGNAAPAASTEEGDSAQGGEEGNRPPKRQRKD
ncbi:Psilocybin cluster transcription regulator [Lactarius tabidus]